MTAEARDTTARTSLRLLAVLNNESNNNSDGNDFDPHSDPKIWNMTLVGTPLCEGAACC